MKNSVKFFSSQTSTLKDLNDFVKGKEILSVNELSNDLLVIYYLEKNNTNLSEKVEVTENE